MKFRLAAAEHAAVVDVELEARRAGRCRARLAHEPLEEFRHVHRRHRRLVRGRLEARELEQVLDDLAHAQGLAAHVGDRLAPFRPDACLPRARRGSPKSP